MTQASVILGCSLPLSGSWGHSQARVHAKPPLGPRGPGPGVPRGLLWLLQAEVKGIQGSVEPATQTRGHAGASWERGLGRPWCSGRQH